MNKEDIKKALQKLRNDSLKRNFTQTVDIIINLKDVDMKNPQNHIEQYVRLPHGRGKKAKVCAFIGPELKEEAEKFCDKIILSEQFDAYAKDKKRVKKLADEFDYFIAQANIMAEVASKFGRVLAPRKKMPTPKAGCIIPPKVALKPVYDKLQDTVKVLVKSQPIIQCAVGNESMDDEQIADNIQAVYNTVVHLLPKESQNIKSVFVKFTMGNPVSLNY